MGWKTLKERFEIKHLVQVTERGICIGSPYVHDILVVDMKTGVAAPSSIFNDFMKDACPLLGQATARETLAAIEATDQFAASIPVYTYDGAEIIEKLCEEPGWPNVTHDGCMMYENTFSTDRAQVIAWAKTNADSAISWRTSAIAEAEDKIAELRKQLVGAQSNRANLDANFPDIEPSS